MNDTIIKTENLRFTYAEAGEVNPLVLDGVSLNIEAGTFVAVLGHNGSGKSTLAKHLNAILLPSGGKVYVDGVPEPGQPDRGQRGGGGRGLRPGEPGGAPGGDPPPGG